jgi:hypothetical protein
MKKFLLISLFAGGVATTALGATLTDASVSNSLNIALKCQDTDCTGPIKGKVSAAATLSISDLEEAELQSDTSITLLVTGIILFAEIPLSLGDDPNFQNGDTSAKIKKTVPIDTGVDLILSAQLKWGDGQLEIKVNGKFVGEIFGLTSLVKNQAKDVPQFPLTIEVVRGVTPVFLVERELIGDVKLLQLQQMKSTGEGTQKIITSVKSTALVPEP